MLLGFKHHHRRAFGEDKPVAIEIERAARGGRIVVPARKRGHVRQAGDGNRGDAGLGAAGDHDIDFAAMEHVYRVDEGLNAGGTGCG